MNSSGTSDSNDGLCGHDMDWSCSKTDLDRVNEELSTCQIIIERYRRFVEHLNWHCHVYRKALRALPAGFQVLSKMMEDTERKREPVCLDCEKDDLLEIIAALNKEVGLVDVNVSAATKSCGFVENEKQALDNA